MQAGTETSATLYHLTRRYFFKERSRHQSRF